MIELLTVIAIIGILSAIIIPVVGSAREAAHSAQCISNLRQIIGAMQMFATDNKDGILRWVDQKPGVTAAAHDLLWNEVLEAGSYLPGYDKSNVWRCISNKEGRYKVGETTPETDEVLRYGMNYAINAVDSADSSDGQRGPSYPYNDTVFPRVRNRLIDLANPSRTIAVCDGHTWLIRSANGAYKGTPAGVHKGGMNAAFWDGHVSKISPVPSLKDPRFSISGQ